MKMAKDMDREALFGTLTFYPQTSDERLLLDRLWEALQSRNFPEWDSVSLETEEFIVYCNTTEPAPADGRDGFSIRSIFREGSFATEQPGNPRTPKPLPRP